MNRIMLTYQKAKPLINEADVLLFRGKGWVSFFIQKAAESPYSHVGVASWVNGRHNTKDGILDCVEFREGKGGRAVNLEIQVNNLPGQIDVYRPIPSVTQWKFCPNPNFIVKQQAEVGQEPFILLRNNLDAKQVTDTMRRMTGLPYGWKRIWWLAKHKMVGFRLFTDVNSLMCDTLEDVVYPVCSTTVAYAFNKAGFDLIHNKCDQWTEPGDIARSARLSYLFTLDP